MIGPCRARTGSRSLSELGVAVPLDHQRAARFPDRESHRTWVSWSAGRLADGTATAAGPAAVTEQPLATRLTMTTLFAVVREPGPTRDHGRPRAEQEAWAEHATFMNALAEAGFVVLGGPLGDGSRNLLIGRRG